MAFDAPFYRWRPHPWHGLSPGADAPRIVQAYIEITPFDLIKFEVDKTIGYLRVDRPQRGSSQPPTLYGFVPQTYYFTTYKLVANQNNRRDSSPEETFRDILRRRIELGRRMTPEQRLLAGLKHSDLCMRVVEDGMRHQNPEADDETIRRLLIERIELMRRMEERR